MDWDFTKKVLIDFLIIGLFSIAAIASTTQIKNALIPMEVEKW